MRLNVYHADADFALSASLPASLAALAFILVRLLKICYWRSYLPSFSDLPADAAQRHLSRVGMSRLRKPPSLCPAHLER